MIYRVTLAAADDFEGWRDAARACCAANLFPEQIGWQVGAELGDLFAEGPPPPSPTAPAFAVPRAFIDLAETVLCHRDPERFALLYTLLLRLRTNSRAMGDEADPLIRRLDQLARAVRRDIHKMRAFVRFREIGEGEAARFVAWFEPEHFILRRNAGFFARRFTSMRWSILTPIGTLHWDAEKLTEGPPARKCDAPQGDPLEETWRTYYSAIFNPARLKIGAMCKEMPKKYWRNMPETALIFELIAGAQGREQAMIAASPSG